MPITWIVVSQDFLYLDGAKIDPKKRISIPCFLLHSSTLSNGLVDVYEEGCVHRCQYKIE
jgi:hypothetical protein